MGILEDFQAIKTKNQALERERARRTADREQATERRDEAMQLIRNEFDVGTVEEAQELLDRMEVELQTDLDTLKAELDEALS